MDIGILSPNIEVVTKNTNIVFKEQAVMLRLPAIYRDMFNALTPKFREKVFCQWELATSFDALKRRIDEMKEAKIMPILLTFRKI